MTTRGSREAFHMYANEKVLPDTFSGVFNFPTLASGLALQGMSRGSFGVKDDSVMIGRKLTPAQLSTMAGSTQLHSKFNTGKMNATKYVGADDTGASAGSSRSTDKFKTVYSSWCEVATATAVPNQIIDANQGPEAIASAIDDAVALAVNEQLEQIATDFYTGAPTSQTADIWDKPIGLTNWIYDGRAGKTIGGLDVNLAANAQFRGAYSTATFVASLQLIDDICLAGVDDGNSGTTTPLFQKHSKADLVVTDLANYNTLKAEAITRGSRAFYSGDIPDASKVGQLNEYVLYNNKIIVGDSYCPANALFVLDSNSWLFQTFKGKNMTMSEFVDNRKVLPGTGQNDITTAELMTKYRIHGFEPWKNAYLTTVNPS